MCRSFHLDPLSEILVQNVTLLDILGAMDGTFGGFGPFDPARRPRVVALPTQYSVPMGLQDENLRGPKMGMVPDSGLAGLLRRRTAVRTNEETGAGGSPEGRLKREAQERALTPRGVNKLSHTDVPGQEGENSDPDQQAQDGKGTTEELQVKQQPPSQGIVEVVEDDETIVVPDGEEVTEKSTALKEIVQENPKKSKVPGPRKHMSLRQLLDGEFEPHIMSIERKSNSLVGMFGEVQDFPPLPPGLPLRDEGSLFEQPRGQESMIKESSSSRWSQPWSMVKSRVQSCLQAMSPSKFTKLKRDPGDVPKLALDGRPTPKIRHKFLESTKAAKARRRHALEKDFSSNTSRKSKAAIRKTISEILLKDEGKGPLPPDEDKLKDLAGILKEAKYKAASIYLGEYKLMAIEAGFTWSQLLERTLQQCKRAVTRAQGPRKKAVEVKSVEGTKDFVPPNAHKRDKLKVGLARELFEFGVIWMLREVELAEVMKEHISMNPANKMVALNLPTSKMDQRASGVLRVLQCLCGEQCKASCPYVVSSNLVKGMDNLKVEYACITKDGKKATKSQLIKDWKLLYGPQVTGHSARRTGALRYIRLLWPLAQVAYLGRWKSNVIYDYASEALESLPVNANPTFGTTNPPTFSPPAQVTVFKQDDTKIDEVRNYLTLELEALKDNQTKALATLDAEVEAIKARGEKSGDRLPLYVQALASKIIHCNMDIPNSSPPHSWRTRCGWHYAKSDYVFVTRVEGGAICKKCNDTNSEVIMRPSNEVENGMKDGDQKGHLL